MSSSRQHGCAYAHLAPPPARGRERGFILVVTLWIIALFGLGVAAINTWLTTAVENARALKTKTEAELALSNAKNEIVYAMGTRPMTARGLEVGNDIKRPNPADIMSVMSADYTSSSYIALDGRPYVLQSDPNYAVELQDGRGLVNLNFATPDLLRRLFALFDVPEELRNQLPDTLADWIDEDDLARLSGAERADYERRNRIGPANAALLTPMEAQSVLGWDQIPQIWAADAKAPIFTTCKVSGFNPNTAPEAALLTYIPGLTPDVAAKIIADRQQSPFQHGRDFIEDSGISVPNDAFFFGVVPGNCVIIDLINLSTNERVRFSLSLAPLTQNQPWQVDYAQRVPSQYDTPMAGLDPGVTFPAPEALALGQSGSNGDGGH